MNYDDAAIAALRFWRPDDAIIAVAIAAAESGEFNDLHGDNISLFSLSQRAVYQSFACDGDLSHGAWQIFCGVHHKLLTAITGNSDPCFWASYLEDAVNCAYVAFLVWFNRGGYTALGWSAWSAFNLGWHVQFLERAEQAIRRNHNVSF